MQNNIINNQMSNLKYFQAIEKHYDGSSRKVKGDIRKAIMREKENAMAVANWLCEGLMEET